MHIDQDDLWVLRHLRAAWQGGEAQRQSERALCQYPGRAEGRVTGWAFGRTARLLGEAARRNLRIGTGVAPTADERAILGIARHIAAGDHAAAELAAGWLMIRGAAADFVDIFAPALDAAYGNGELRRKMAARA